jgi:formylglycine-generating enzyme required for sulfatase activity
MRIFLSYSSQDRSLAESICASLRAQRHQVFFDRSDLPSGEEYDGRIRRAIERSQLFVFLVSPSSLREDSYARTELAIAQRARPHPAGRLLPVLVAPVALERIPPYLTSVTLLEPVGHVPAAVTDAVHQLMRKRRHRLLARTAAGIVLGGVVALGAYAYWNRGEPRVLTGRDGARALLVPAGAFTMGDNEEAPRREVYVDAFYVDEYEVTVAQFARFLEDTGSVNLPDGSGLEFDEAHGMLPVVGVDWHDANDYCGWAGRRLPTDAEWEKAARGTDERVYPWGDEPPTPQRAVFGRPVDAGAYEGGLAPVGSHPDGRSPYGVHDLAGNASEWVADWYTESYDRGDVRNPKGPAAGTSKIIRGGGWYDPPGRLKASRRMFASPGTSGGDTGFRCARDAGAP